MRFVLLWQTVSFEHLKCCRIQIYASKQQLAISLTTDACKEKELNQICHHAIAHDLNSDQ